MNDKWYNFNTDPITTYHETNYRFDIKECNIILDMGDWIIFQCL
jgi:hypothetical protein